MPRNFLTQIENVRRSRQWRRRVAISCWSLATVLATALVLIGLDCALGLVDPVGRTVWTMMFVVVCLAVLRRWFILVREATVHSLDIAQEIERRQPELRDVVTSAWDFGHQSDDDRTAGSLSLRRAVVLRAAAAVEEFDWQQLLPRQALRQSSLALGSAGLAIALLGWFLPQPTAIGLARLVNPFSDAEWPRDHDLQFIEPPSKLFAGDDLVLRLHDTRGTLPAEIALHYRTRQQGRWSEQIQSVPTATQPLEIRRTNVQEALQFRATGGDHHSMSWHSLAVVAAPKIEELQVAVHPPSYTGLPPQPLDSINTIYAGSRLELRGRIDKPLKQVVLRATDGEQLVTQLSDKGQAFRIDPTDWRVERSDVYYFQLTTVDGLTTRAALELAVEVIADRPPQVRFVEPTSDLTVLPTAAIPLVIEATDEFAVHEIELAYHRSDQSDQGEQRLSLWKMHKSEVDSADMRQQRFDYQWQLEPLSLKSGSVIDVRAQAHDGQPTTGQSVRALRIVVVSEEQLWQQLVQQQARLVEVLEQLWRDQRELVGITVDWQEVTDWSVARWVNASHAALFRQRRIADTLSAGQGSVIEQLTELSRTIERNGLLRPDALDRLDSARLLLQNLVDEPLAQARQSLRDVARQSQRSTELQTLASSLDSLGRQQEEAAVGLRRVVDLLLPGNIQGRLERELIALETDQRALKTHCQTELASMLLHTDNENSLNKATLSAAGRQQELAHRATQLMLEMSQASKQIADEQPTLAARLAETVSLAAELDLQVTIQSAADQLSDRRLGRVASLQQQVLEDLAKLRARLAGHDAEGAAKRLEQLQTAERDLQRLRRQVAKLQRELSEQSAEEKQRELERLRRQREQLAQQSEKLTRELERLRMPKAAQSTAEATSELRRATLDSETTKQAQHKLEDAQRQLTTERRRQQVALARLEMAQLDAKYRLVGRTATVD